MRLKEIYIERYGPLNRLCIEFNPGVQPIFGDNESGKTLLVDCIIKMLSGKGVGWDPLLDRVAETPEGFIILEDDTGEIKLEKGRTLADYLSIDPSELRNIFIIREADLKIPEENVFYEKITDKITGLRSKDIGRIIEKLREIGRLTPTNNLSDASTLGKPKSKVEEAKRLQNEIKRYLEEAEEKNIPQLEANLFQAKIEENQLRETISLLKKAKEKDDFLDLENKLLEAKELLKELKKKPAEETLSSLQVKLEECKRKEIEEPFLQRINQTSKKLSLISIPSATIIWIALIIFGINSIIELILPFILLITLVSSFISFFYSSRRLSNIDNDRKELFVKAEETGIFAKTLVELTEKLGRLRGDIEKFRGSLNQNIGVLKNFLKIKGENEEEILKVAETELSQIKSKIDFNISLKFDEKKLREAEGEIESIHKKLDKLNDEIRGHKDELKRFSDRVHKLEFSTFAGRELELEIENLESLRLLQKELEDFSNKIENEAELCREAIAIFDEMGKEEEAKIKELFDQESLASELFRELTEERYSKVFYDPDKKEIVVVRPSGEEFPACKLSRGAFDQLYMSIRIDLAQRILGGKKSFFIMDDAFLSSGPRRFRKALEIIKKLVDTGWSITYFTAKLEDANALAKVSGNKVIKLPSLP